MISIFPHFYKNWIHKSLLSLCNIYRGKKWWWISMLSSRQLHTVRIMLIKESQQRHKKMQNKMSGVKFPGLLSALHNKKYTQGMRSPRKLFSLEVQYTSGDRSPPLPSRVVETARTIWWARDIFCLDQISYFLKMSIFCWYSLWIIAMWGLKLIYLQKWALCEVIESEYPAWSKVTDIIGFSGCRKVANGFIFCIG